MSLSFPLIRLWTAFFFSLTFLDILRNMLVSDKGPSHLLVVLRNLSYSPKNFSALSSAGRLIAWFQYKILRKSYLNGSEFFHYHWHHLYIPHSADFYLHILIIIIIRTSVRDVGYMMEQKGKQVHTNYVLRSSITKLNCVYIKR